MKQDKWLAWVNSRGEETNANESNRWKSLLTYGEVTNR